MKRKNRYARLSRLSTRKFCQLLRCFAIDLDASQIAELTGLNRNTVNRYLRAIRQRILEFCETQSPFSGEIEVDELFFGARRIKGKRGRGAFGKTIIFGLFKRRGKVYTEIVADCSKATPQAIIRGLSWRALSTPMAGGGTTDWLMWVTASIYELTMGNMNS